MRPFVIAVLVAAAVQPAWAQSEMDRAQALVLPMIQEIQPGRAGEVLTGCLLAAATTEEIAALAAAPGPSAEIGALINTLLQRPATLQCLQAAAQG